MAMRGLDIEGKTTFFGQGTHAIVVFTDLSRLRCLKWLRRGYRHCFVVLCHDALGLIYDPMANCTVLAGIERIDRTELRNRYHELGYTIVETAIQSSGDAVSLFRPFTCVEAVKRVLGIHAPWVFTPWQLYQYLVHRDTQSRIKVLTSQQKKEYYP